jgi:site-specific DNA-methyltransferase (adenine-specific)
MKINKQTIILGDSLEILKTMKDKTFDTIITSPPYNIGVSYNSYIDKMEKENYLEWIKNIFTECKRVMTNNGSLFLNVGATNINPWVCYEVAFTLKDLFVLQNDIVWVKSISIKDESYGHYKPINSKRYLNHMYEHIFHFTKNGQVEIKRKNVGVPYKYKCNLKAKTVTEDVRCRGNTWFIPYETIHTKTQRGKHPAVFPVKLVDWCIKLSNGKKILDPFLGSGTTLEACELLDVEGVGIEIDEEYYNFAKERLNNVIRRIIKFER